MPTPPYAELRTSVDDLRSTLGCRLQNTPERDLDDEIEFARDLLKECPETDKSKRKVIETHLRKLEKRRPASADEDPNVAALTTLPPTDGNFKAALEDANMEALDAAYEAAFKAGQKTRFKAIRAEIKRRLEESSLNTEVPTWEGRTKQEEEKAILDKQNEGVMERAREGNAQAIRYCFEHGLKYDKPAPAAPMAVVTTVPAGARRLNGPEDLDAIPAQPLTPALVTPVERFGLVNQYHQLAKMSMAQSCAYMILAGVELLALKQDAEHGTWETLFPARVGDKSESASTFGFTYETGRNYMRLADAARKHVPALRELGAGEKQLSLMSPEEQEKIVAVVKKVGDGSTYQDLAKQWGLVKKAPGNGGGAQTSPEKKEKPLTPQQAAERAAQDQFHPLNLALFKATSEGEKQKLLNLPITTDAPGDITGLADLRDHASAFLALVEAALEERKATARKSRN